MRVQRGRRRAGFAAAVVLGITGVASAQSAPSGVYAGGSGGLAYRQPAEDVAARNTFDTGWNVNGVAGYRVSAWRVEGEFTVFRNDFKEITLFAGGASLPPEASEGAARGRSLFASVYYDVPTGGAIRPYLGGGLGTYKVHIDRLTSPTLGSFGVVVDETTGWTRVIQLRGGLSIPMNDATELFAGYRWHRGFPLTFTVPGIGELNPGGARTHSGEFGARFFFGR